MNSRTRFLGLLASRLVCAAALVAVPVVWASEFSAGTMAEGAPPELLHWQKLVGQWSTVEEGLNPDNSEWEPSKGADWNFFWAFDGWGIQDDYTSPPADVELQDESTRQRGINLRIFNTAEKKWTMTWLTPSLASPATFTAVSNDKEIVMLAAAVNPQGFHSRITFFAMTEATFDWKLEWSKDQENWFEVYRIHGIRKSG